MTRDQAVEIATKSALEKGTFKTKQLAKLFVEMVFDFDMKGEQFYKQAENIQKLEKIFLKNNITIPEIT